MERIRNLTNKNMSRSYGKQSVVTSLLNTSLSIEGNDKPKSYSTPPIPNKIGTKSQREKLVSTPRISLDDIGGSSVDSVSSESLNVEKQPPRSLEEDVKNCFGFEDFSSPSNTDRNLNQSTHPDKSNNTTIQSLAGISPVRRASILPQKGKLGSHLPGFNDFNSTSLSISSPTQPKTHATFAEESRIISGNFLVPAAKTSRFTSRSSKDAIASRFPPPICNLPQSSKVLSPKLLLQRNSIPLEKHTKSTKQLNVNKETQKHERVEINENSLEHAAHVTKYQEETEGNCLIPNLDTNKENLLSEDVDYDDADHVEATVGIDVGIETRKPQNGKENDEEANKNAFVVLKETNKAKTQINKERAILKRKNPVALKPFKVQKQTKVYETVGNTKQLKTAKIITNSKLRYVYLDVLADSYPNAGRLSYKFCIILLLYCMILSFT